MEKKTLVAICMAVPGGILFSIGMVLALMTEWGMLIAGIIMGVIGLAILLLIIPIYRRLAGYPKMEFNSAVVSAYIFGALFALILGVGMALIMVPTPALTWQIVLGMIIGVVGLVGVILNPVIYIAKKNGIK